MDLDKEIKRFQRQMNPQERTLKESDKKNLKKETKSKCQKCGKKYPPYNLIVHHKKPIAKYKTNDLRLSDFNKFYSNKTKKPAYDRKSNLMVLCRNCHGTIHYELSEKEKKKKTKHGKKKTDNFGFPVVKLPKPPMLYF
jgi:predicted HNH restriction endonuclease